MQSCRMQNVPLPEGAVVAVVVSVTLLPPQLTAVTVMVYLLNSCRPLTVYPLVKLFTVAMATG